MMHVPSTDELNIYKQWPTEAAQNWIATNKPNDSASENISTLFIAKIAYLNGNDDYKKTIENLVCKASKTATGYELLNRLINLNAPINIEQSEKFFFSSKDNVLHIPNFSKVHCSCLNENNEYELVKITKLVAFVHELIHLSHNVQNEKKIPGNIKTKVIVPQKMTCKEELLTITGNLHLENVFQDFCCENTLRTELGLRVRVNHREGMNEALTLDSAIEHGAVGSVKKIIAEGTIPSDDSLGLALKKGCSREMIQVLLKGGAQPPSHLLDIEIDPLEYDQAHESVRLLETLVKVGIKPSKVTFKSTSNDSLNAALQKKYPIEVIEALIEGGAQPSSQSLDLVIDPLEYNQAHGAARLLEMLIKAGAKPSKQTLSTIAYIRGEIEDEEILKILSQIAKMEPQ